MQQPIGLSTECQGNEVVFATVLPEVMKQVTGGFEDINLAIQEIEKAYT